MTDKGRDILSHAGIYLAARGLPGLIAFLAIPLFSRLLEPAEYGRYALVFGAVGVLNALLFQWLRLSMVRYLPAHADEPAALKSTLATVCGAMVLSAGVLTGLACLAPSTEGWRTALLLGWAALAAQAAFELCCEYARGTLRPWHYMRLQVVRSGVFVALGVAFVLAGSGWWGPLAGLCAGMLLAAGIAWRGDWAGVRPRIDRELLAKLARYGVPLSLTVALTVVIATSDRYLIAAFSGEDAAGLYSVAVDFTTQTITLLMMSVYLAAFPMAVRAWEGGGAAAAGERMRSNAALLMAIGVPCVVGLTVLAPGVSRCFLGESYRDAAAGIMPLVALGTFLAGMKAYHFDAAFQFADRTLSQVWIVLVAAVLNVGLNVIAIPRWGLSGAAGASALAYLVAIGLTILLGRRHVKLPVPAGDCVKVLLAAALMALALAPLRSYTAPVAVAAQIAGGAVLYAAVLISANFIDIRGAVMARFGRDADVPRGTSATARPALSPLAPAVSEVG